jgi:hypothetical protein
VQKRNKRGVAKPRRSLGFAFAFDLAFLLSLPPEGSGPARALFSFKSAFKSSFCSFYKPRKRSHTNGFQRSA